MRYGFRGTMEKCLEHFVAENKFNVPSGTIFSKRNRICLLLGVGNNTGHAWFNKERLPLGEQALRLRVFLEFLGYTIMEREMLMPILSELSVQIALGTVSRKDVADYLGTTVDVVLDMISGRQGVSAQREETVKALLELHRSDTAQRKKEWLDVIALLDLAGIANDPQVAVHAMTTTMPTVRTKDASDSVAMLAHLLMAIKPLAERVDSDEFSAEDRKRLRELVRNGRSNLVFDLSNIFTRLCGERARNELATSQNHKESQS